MNVRSCEICGVSLPPGNSVGAPRRLCGSAACKAARLKITNRKAYLKRTGKGLAPIVPPPVDPTPTPIPLCYEEPPAVLPSNPPCLICGIPLPKFRRLLCDDACSKIHNRIDTAIKGFYPHPIDRKARYRQALRYIAGIRQFTPAQRKQLVYTLELKLRPSVFKGLDSKLGTNFYNNVCRLGVQFDYDLSDPPYSTASNPALQASPSPPPPSTTPFSDLADMFIPPDDTMVPDPELPDIDLEEDAPPEENAIELSRRYFGPGEKA